MKKAMWFVAMVSFVSLPLLFIGCMSDEDLYDPAKAEALLKEEYKKKFIAQYGEIAPDYSWDATSMKPKYASTRATNYKPSVSNDYYVVEQGTRDWLADNLKTNVDNRHKGKKFMMTVPVNPFTLVPISQDEALLSWSLYIVVGGIETKVWTKNEGIQTKNSSWSSWQNLGTWGHKTTTGAKEVRAKRYTFDLTDHAGEVMYFYLLIENDAAPNCAKKGTKQSSLDGMMLALDCPRPENAFFNGKEVRIIGCEDANLDGSDWDLNDVVFLMYGDPKIPDEIEITNDEIKESVTKRYMIEDLGSTDDFDFNDVVVDVTEERTLRITKENGVITKTENVKTEQKATIRHLGGTLPFRLTIGNTTLEEMQGALNENPDKEYSIQGWLPEQNNISVAVRGMQNDDEVYTVSFPADGEAPMIIAVDPTVNWMEERVKITKEWFDGLKK